MQDRRLPEPGPRQGNVSAALRADAPQRDDQRHEEERQEAMLRGRVRATGGERREVRAALPIEAPQRAGVGASRRRRSGMRRVRPANPHRAEHAGTLLLGGVQGAVRQQARGTRGTGIRAGVHAGSPAPNEVGHDACGVRRDAESAGWALRYLWIYRYGLEGRRLPRRSLPYLRVRDGEDRGARSAMSLVQSRARSLQGRRGHVAGRGRVPEAAS